MHNSDCIIQRNETDVNKKDEKMLFSQKQTPLLGVQPHTLLCRNPLQSPKKEQLYPFDIQ